MHQAPPGKPVARTIHAKLTAALAPSLLEIIDESHRHAGHSAEAQAGESHFRLRIVSARFEGLNRLARHRLVNATLADELNGKVHALALETLSPAEAARPKIAGGTG